VHLQHFAIWGGAPAFGAPSRLEQYMAHTIDHGRSRPFFTRLRTALGNWRRDFERHRRFERVYGELSQLSDRELADIGLSRSQVVDTAWDASDRG
jgi:uncharacterized protein YjiS (DUF1127 family)